jgi:hypothetical protein
LTNFSDKKQLTQFSFMGIKYSNLVCGDSRVTIQGVSRDLRFQKFDKAKVKQFLEDVQRFKTTPNMQFRENTKSFDSKLKDVEEYDELGENSRNLSQLEKIRPDSKLTKDQELALKRGGDTMMRLVDDAQKQDAWCINIDDYLIYIHQSFYRIVTNEFLSNLKRDHELDE